MSFADRLKEARKRAGITQKELADKLGTTPQNYAQYEAGKRTPKRETLLKIAEALEVGYSYTKNGEIYFYGFVDTVDNPKYEKNKQFNAAQLADAEKFDKIITSFDKLNDKGQEKAIEQVDLLTKIPEYQREETD